MKYTNEDKTQEKEIKSPYLHVPDVDVLHEVPLGLPRFVVAVESKAYRQVQGLSCACSKTLYEER